MGVHQGRRNRRLDLARLVRVIAPRPPKRRRLKAPIEPDLYDPAFDDARSALYKHHRRNPQKSVDEAESASARNAVENPSRESARSRASAGNASYAGIPSATRARRSDSQRPRDAGTKASRTVPAEPSASSAGSRDVLSDSPPQDAGYAELHCVSNFSFQRGASSAPELFERAQRLGYAALAITDECSLAGIVRALEASKKTQLKLIVGTEVRLADGPRLVLLARNQDGYTDICRLITRGRRRSAKGEYRLDCADAETLGDGVLVLWAPVADTDRETAHVHAAWVAQHFVGRAWLAVELHRGCADAKRLAMLRELGALHGLALVASGDVHMHTRRRRALQDVMTAIRLGCSVAEAGHALFPNGERHLRRIEDIAALHPPELLAETLRIAAMCEFNLRNLKYEYPNELVDPGRSAIECLSEHTWKGARKRWPGGIPDSVKTQLEKELALIQAKEYEHFFLTVQDIVHWARNQNPPILCQGRGSSANSAVCYCLGITVVTPENGELLFERFLSMERNEPPDIDVDFEHERREEVIQYVFGKYGRDRAALAATVICYRGRSAVRDVGRALGVAEDQLDRLCDLYSRVRSGKPLEHWLRERGFDPSSGTLHRLFALAAEIDGFPRHLSQHVGGFVISEKPLHYLVPVENAAMPERTIIQWDKDDLEEMKLLKVDCLALGMLTALRKCLDLLHAHGIWPHPYIGARPRVEDIPPGDDERVYDMICDADTVGVFQIESRAQMSMLPRLQPRCFYDLVVEIAIVRPGPIQGQMVHPYLRRRKGLEAVDYPQSRDEREAGTGSAIEGVLKRTLGVPIFQEQVMKLIQVVAGFSAGQADELRRAMAAWKRRGGLEPFYDRIRNGMLDNGYSQTYFERIFEQIKGFGEYGFPESHSASFAKLAYASSWLKHYFPAAFTCALLNAQPMGFYQPSQLIQDAQKNGVRVLPADVTMSLWDCTLEAASPEDCRDASTAPDAAATPLALRLGLRQIRGLSEAFVARLVAAREAAPFRDVADMTRRAAVTAQERARLADADALRTLSGHRHRARWDSAGAELPAPLLGDAVISEQRVALRRPSLRQDVMTDYATQGLSLKGHPLALIRDRLDERRALTALAAGAQRNGVRLRCAGLVTVRQHPGTAKGVTFVTLEDETGFVNIVVWRALAEAQHRVLLESVVMGVDGVLQVSEGVRHVVAKKLYDYSALLPEFGFASRDFH